MPDEKCPNCGALGTVRGPHDPDCPLHPAYAMKDAGKPLFVVERGPVEDPKPAGSVEVSECKACLARTVGADAEIAHKDWCPLLAVTKAQRIFQPGDRVRFNAKNEGMVGRWGKFARYNHDNTEWCIVSVDGGGVFADYHALTNTLDYIPPAESLARDYVAGDRIRVTSGKFKGQFGLVTEARPHTLRVMLDDADLGMDFTKFDVEIAPDTRQAKSRDDVEAGPKVGDVVYLRSDRHYDTPMVVKEVQTNNGYLGTAWLDPSKQICTWFAPADCFMPKPRARVGHREDLGDVRRNNSRPSADGDW